MTMNDKKVTTTKPQPYWLIYVSIFLAGLMLLADAFHYTALQKISARLGITLIISALNLIIGRGQPAGYIASAILVIALIITLFV